MPVATGTALLISAGVSAIGAGASFAQGAAQKRKQREAEKAAERAMGEARKKAEVNYLEGLQVPTEAYDRAFENSLASQQQALTSLQEADPRALAGGVGKVSAVGVQLDTEARVAMGQELYKNELLKAQAQEKVKQDLMTLDLGEAQGAQIAASQAQQQAAQSFTQGIQGVAQAGQTLYQGSALYGKNTPPTGAANKLPLSGLTTGQIDLAQSGLENKMMDSLSSLQQPRLNLVNFPGLTPDQLALARANHMKNPNGFRAPVAGLTF